MLAGWLTTSNPRGSLGYRHLVGGTGRKNCVLLISGQLLLIL